MTCAQGLLRLLWGRPEVGVLRDWERITAAVETTDEEMLRRTWIEI